MGYFEIKEKFPMMTVWNYDTLGSYTRWWSYDTTSWGREENYEFFVILIDSVSFPLPGGREKIGMKTHITPLGN